ncbi:MAG: histidine phosphatase family protein, partial [Pseudomonadota bacterium]
MPDLYVLRHGQTDWNAEGRLQGATDIPLNALGRSQARRNGEALAAHLPDPSALRYAASPLRRASETLAIAREAMGLEREDFHRDERLMEARFGAWEGRLMRDIKAEEPDLWEAARLDRWNVTPPGAEGTAESFKTLAARVEAFLAETIHTASDDMLVATHGGTMRVIRVLFGESAPEIVGTL